MKKNNTGQKVKTIRLALGLSQMKLATLFKVEQNMISQIETERRPLPRDLANILIDICKEQGFKMGTRKNPITISLDYLYRDDESS